MFVVAATATTYDVRAISVRRHRRHRRHRKHCWRMEFGHFAVASIRIVAVEHEHLVCEWVCAREHNVSTSEKTGIVFKTGTSHDSPYNRERITLNTQYGWYGRRAMLHNMLSSAHVVCIYNRSVGWAGPRCRSMLWLDARFMLEMRLYATQSLFIKLNDMHACGTDGLYARMCHISHLAGYKTPSGLQIRWRLHTRTSQPLYYEIPILNVSLSFSSSYLWLAAEQASINRRLIAIVLVVLFASHALYVISFEFVFGSGFFLFRWRRMFLEAATLYMVYSCVCSSVCIITCKCVCMMYSIFSGHCLHWLSL